MEVNLTPRQPGIEILHLDADSVSFVLKGFDASVANALRRVIIADVSTLAIDLVHIEKNDGIMRDNILAHRIGLIPIRFDPNGGWLRSCERMYCILTHSS